MALILGTLTAALGKHKWKILIALLVGLGLYLWASYTLAVVNERNTAQNSLSQQLEKNKELRAEIDGIIIKSQVNSNGFREIDQNNIDLYCAANYKGAPVAPEPPATEIIEVVKWRDRPQPIAVPIPVEVPPSPEAERVQQEVSAASLNNGWKAYCLATGNKDETCAPFR